MKKLFVIIFLSVLNYSILFSAGPLKSLLPPDIQKIKDRGKLIVAIHIKDFIPYIMKDDQGELIGYDIDLARGIAKILDVAVEFNREGKTFNEVVDVVANGKADCAISLLSVTLARAEKVRFSNPYIVLHPTLLLNRVSVSKFVRNNPIDWVAELQTDRLRIGEPKGNSYVDIAKNIFPKANVAQKENWDEVMAAVLKGEIDIVVRDEIGVKNYIYQNPEQSVQLQMVTLFDPKYNDSIAIAVPAQSTHFIEWINLYLERNNLVNTADDLIKRYADYYAK